MIDAFRKLYALLDTRGRRRFALLVILMLFDALLEIASLHLVPAYVGLVAYPERIQAILPEGWELGPHSQLVLWGSLAIVLFFSLKLLVNARVAAARIRFSQKTALKLSNRLLDAYLHAPLEYHLQHNSAELQRNLNNGSIQLAEQVLVPLTDLLAQGVIIVAVGSILFIYIPAAPLAILLGVLSVAGYLILRQQQRLQREGREVQQLHKQLIKTANEALTCAKEIALLGREEFFVERFQRLFHRSQDCQRHMQIMRGKLIPGGVELATIIALASMITLMFHQGVTPERVLASVTIAAVGLARLKGSLSGFMGAFSLVQHRKAVLDSIHTDLVELPAPPPQALSDAQPQLFRHQLQLKEIHYRYPNSENEVLRGMDLTIQKGEAIGFIGKTGAGKSTLIDIIMGLLKPTGGEILLDGEPFDRRLDAWQRQIGYVPQMLSLIDGTIRENIALGLPPDRIDEHAVCQAVDQAQLGELIETLPKGLDTVVGERGIRLSGGQRQRLVIARALYHDPSVIVFDEGTSALDSETEAEVIRAVGSLKGHKTVLMIAHRLSTLQNCSRTYSVQDGTLVQIQLADAQPQKTRPSLHTHNTIPKHIA